MADINDLTPSILTAAGKPRSASTDTASVSQHPLPDQIEAAKFCLGQAAAGNNKLGIRFRKFLPPGTSGIILGGLGGGYGGGRHGGVFVMLGIERLTSWFKRLTSPSPRGERVAGVGVGLKARYESALTTDDTWRQWSLVDFLSAKAANTFEVRRILRMRSRFMRDNNPVFGGMVRTYSRDVVGKGPRLQCKFPNPAWNQAIETAHRSWWLATQLTRRLRVAVEARVVDGEAFFLEKTDRTLNDAVKLYPQDIETDQVQTVNPEFKSGYWVDGMELDQLGKPTIYHVLKRHPGDLTNLRPGFSPLDNVRIPARYVIHWFTRSRPGQVRGVPELTASLNLFEQVRRFDKATLTAAEWAAEMSAVLETDLGADDGDNTVLGQAWDVWQAEMGTVSTLPAGYHMKQMTPTQPAGTHAAFTATLTGNAARPIGMPYNVAASNSSGYNFSSGRLDHLPYFRGIDIERKDCEEIVLDHLNSDWYDEAIMVPGLLPDDLVRQIPTFALVPHIYHWPGMDSIDPQKDAAADQANLANGTTTLAEICGRNGADWRDVMRQRAEERAFALELAEEFGLPPGWNSAAPASSAPPPSAASPEPASGDDGDEPAGDGSEPAPAEEEAAA